MCNTYHLQALSFYHSHPLSMDLPGNQGSSLMEQTQQTSTVQPSATGLFDLPNELLLTIIDFSDYGSRMALSQTNGLLRTLAKFELPRTKEQKLQALHAFETWPEYVPYLEC